MSTKFGYNFQRYYGAVEVEQNLLSVVVGEGSFSMRWQRNVESFREVHSMILAHVGDAASAVQILEAILIVAFIESVGLHGFDKSIESEYGRFLQDVGFEYLLEETFETFGKMWKIF